MKSTNTGKIRCRLLEVFRLSRAADQGSLYEIQNFKDEPGIYYEEIGTAALFRDVWSLAIDMNVNSLMVRELQACEYLRYLRGVCGNSDGGHELCGKTFVSMVDQSIKAIKMDVGVIHDLLDEDPVRRVRRYLFDSLGSVIKAITGNMDAADAERISSQIKELQEDQVAMREGIKDQLQIVNSTVEMFNSSALAMERNLGAFREFVNGVSVNVSKNFNRLEWEFRVHERMDMLESIVQTLRTDLGDLIDLLEDVAIGRINAKVLAPEQLLEYLLQAAPHIPRGRSFPMPLTRGNVPSLLKVSEVKAFRRGNIICIVVQIPLLEQGDFGVKRIYPLPIRAMNDTFYFLEPVKDILVVDNGNRKYVQLTESELSSCKRLGDRFICKRRRPIMTVSDAAPCEILMFVKRGRVNEERCAKRALKVERTLLLTLQQENRWLFVAPSDEAITIECEGMPTQREILRGSGILALVGQCVVSAADFELAKGHEVLQRVSRGYLPPVNLTLTDKELEVFQPSLVLNGTLALESVVGDPQELREIGMRLHHMRAALDAHHTKGLVEKYERTTQMVHGFWYKVKMGACALFVCVVAVVILYVSCRVKRCLRKRASVAPLQVVVAEEAPAREFRIPRPEFRSTVVESERVEVERPHLPLAGR